MIPLLLVFLIAFISVALLIMTPAGEDPRDDDATLEEFLR